MQLLERIHFGLALSVTATGRAPEQLGVRGWPLCALPPTLPLLSQSSLAKHSTGAALNQQVPEEEPRNGQWAS